MSETDAPEAAPTCYRHTDRETYVRCTRCDRYICPDCMNDAAVGFQCPECVREGNKSVRQAQTVFGGRADSGLDVTKVLIGLNVLAFVVQLATIEFETGYFMRPQELAHRGEYYRMVTSAFLHDRRMLLHIAFNMYALLAIGSQIERLLGPVRYLTLYAVAAIGGSVATYVFVHPLQPSLGASGAIFGLFGAFFVFARRLRGDTSQILMMIGINLAIGFTFRGYINNYAHIGGLVAGGVVAFAFAHAPKGPRRANIQFGGAALVLAALVVATVARTGYLREKTVYVETGDNRRNESAASVAGTPSR